MADRLLGFQDKIMAYAIGLRLLAAVCFLTVVLSPLGVVLWWKARRVEAEREREVAALEELADNQ